MQQKILIILGIVVAVMILLGANGRLWARPTLQEGIVLEDAAEVVDMDVDGRISYQGYLTNPNTGDPLSGAYNMRFRLWDAVSGGSQVGADIVKNNVAVAEGLFNVVLDIPDETFDGQGRWLQIQVGGEWLNPRREILPVPYALSLRPGALISGRVEGASVTAVNTRTDGWAGAVYGRINSNVDNSVAVYGFSEATTGWSNGVTGGTRSGEGVGVIGYNESETGGIGVWGKSDATTGWAAGVQGISDSPEGVGVIGTNTATSGSTRGVEGESYSPDGVGVYGHNNAAGGTAIHALSAGTGIFAESYASDGTGIVGFAASTTGSNTGVQGIVDSALSGNSGVSGVSRAATGEGRGVFGDSNSPDGSGVFGYNDDGGNGILGITDNGTGSGVHGASYSASGYGVSGVNYATSGWSIGVYGETSSPDGATIIGINTATTGSANAVKGVSSSIDGAAVVGWNEAGGIGLQGYSSTGTALTVGSMHGNLIEAFQGNGSDLKFYVSNDGDVFADGTYQSPAADFAEMLPAHEGLEPGDVLIIGVDGQLTLSIEPYQTSVVGVYSTAPGFLGGATENADMTDNIPLAIVGIVPVKVSAEAGSIQPGNLLTTSATPGYAMVCYDRLDCIGAIIGKALEPLSEGSGTISVLITLQ